MIIPKRQITFLERKEVEQIIKKIKNKGMRNLRDKALLETLFSTGLRISEALSLPDAPFVNAVAMTKELSIVGKGGWQRTIYFSPSAMEAIGRYLKVKKDESLLLFPITPRAAQIMVKKRAKAAGIEKRVTPHIFRHSFATYMLKEGVNIFNVQNFLGHRALSSTSVYLHVSNKDLLDLHKKIYT